MKLAKAKVRQLRMQERLDGFRKALRIIENYRTKDSRYFLLNLSPTDESLFVIGYKEGELEAATQQYLAIERDKTRLPGADVVLARADSIDSLRRAYPNYFLDTEYFLNQMKECLGIT